MATNARVAIELYVDDKGTLRVKKFADDAGKDFRNVEQAGVGAATGIQGAWEKVQGAWVGIIGGIMAMREAWNMMNTAAKAKQEEAAFASLAASYGSNGKKILASLKEVSAGTVDTMTLIRNAGTAMMMGIAPDDVVKLMEIARATAKMTGQTTVKAFEDISLAVGRQSKMILDNLGIILDVEKANEEYAVSLGKTASQLTDVERKQAFMQATMRAGEELMGKLGHQTDTAADKFERFTATMADWKTKIGDGLIRVFYFLEGGFTAVAAGALAASGGIFKMVEGVGWLTDKLRLTSGAAAEWKINAEAAFGAAGELVDKANQSYKDMMSSNDAIIAGQTAFQKQLQVTTEAIGEQHKAQQKIVDAHKKAADEQAAAEKEMYREAGFGAERYFSSEATELIKKARRWQEAGADVYQVEEWLYEQIGKLSADAWAKEETAAGLAMDSLQAQSRTLVEQMNATMTTAEEQLQGVGVEIANLDGSHIGITASLDGAGVTSAVEGLIVKFTALEGAANSAAAAAAAAATQSTYRNDDPNKSARQVWEEEQKHGGSGGGSTVININQQLSRSDVTAIAAEQRRREARA